MALDSDPRRSASHNNLIGHLAGPLLAGTTETTLPFTGSGAGAGMVATVDWVSRQPLALVGTRAPLAERGLTVTVQVTPRSGGTGGNGVAVDALAPAALAPISTTLRFAPFSEAGAFLPVWPPSPLPIPDAAPPFDVLVAAADPRVTATLAELLELRVIEGVLGRLLYVIGAEKQRLRRQARELLALRQLPFAFDETDPDHLRMGPALDRLGADLGIPRLTDQLGWDAQKQEPLSVSVREPNEAYRRRLKMYRPFLLPNRRRVEEALDQAGVSASISEPNSAFAVAIQLVSSPNDAPRKALLDWLRANQLVQPGAPIPATRLLPNLVRTNEQAILDRIGGAGGTFTFPSGSGVPTPFVAPLLAAALDRAGRCRRALGVTRPWRVLRAQDDAGGSRYELGLGVDVETPPAAELDLMAQNATAGSLVAGTDLEIQQLVGSLAPVPSSSDPIGGWLLRSCGFQTIHAITGGNWYLSHFPMAGALIRTHAGAPLALEARFEAPGDPGGNAVLVNGLLDAAADAAAAHIPAWTESPSSGTPWAGASVPEASALAAFAAAELTTPNNAADLGRTLTALGAVPPELLTVLVLDATMSAGVLANSAPATQQLAALVQSLRRRELVSALPLVRGTAVLLVVGVVSLPGAGAPLTTRRLGFRWYVLPVSGLAGALDRVVGARSNYTLPAAQGLAAVVAVSLARGDQEDPRGIIRPYEVRVDLPGGALIDLPAFERMMNLLERAVPLGVVVDTGGVREAHVDPTGTGTAVPLIGRLSHTFRSFRQRRHLGIINNDNDQ